MPINDDFQTKRQIVGEHNGHKVWEPVEPPEKLGIHGTNVAVDWDTCVGVASALISALCHCINGQIAMVISFPSEKLILQENKTAYNV